MDNVEEIKALEQRIKDVKVHIELAAALDRLSNNRDFRKIVVEGYFEKEAIRLVHAKSNPGMQVADKQASIVKQIDGIGCFVQYLELLHANGQRALMDTAETEAQIVELNNTEAEAE